MNVESEWNDTERQGKEGKMFGFKEVDADLNVVEFILSAVVGVVVIVAPLLLKFLLLKGGF